MSSKKCPKCNTVFKYASILKKHMLTTVRCKSTIDEIDNHLKIKAEIVNINNFACSECNSIFTRKSSLQRHENNSKCSTIKNIKNKISTKGIGSISIDELQLVQPETVNTLYNLTNLNKTPNIQNNTTNNNNTTINNNTNNTDNSKNLIINNTIIQHIMPFRYEDPRDIAIEDMIRILKSGEKAGLEILKLIYNKIENKNFYKNNIGKNNITYLTDNYDVDVCQEDELKKSLFNRSITLLHHMLYICKDKLRVNDIKDIYANIECISGMVRSEIYDNGLKNIMENEIRKHNKNSKDKITNYIKHLNCNPEEKQLALEMVNDMKVENNDVNIEFKQAITMGELNNKLGDPSKSEDLDYNKVYEDFSLKKFDDTSYNKYWKNRIREEKKYIRSSKKANIRDIVELDKREEKIKMILNKMEEVHKEFVNGDDLKVEIPDEYKYTNKYIEA
jgi:hypothetical protein